MLLSVTKEIRIGKNVVKLYSLDGGKTWFSRPTDFRAFKERRRCDEKISRLLVATNVAEKL
jgi:hypothetical protein